MPLGPLSQPGASARLPDAPTGVSASAVSGGQASITFTPSLNPGKPSGDYVATASPGPVTGSASVSPIAITGLTVGTAYTFTVVKQSGSGITSNSSSATGSITAFTAPTFGTQTGTSTATAPSGSTTSVSSVSTTTATLDRSIGSGATFYDYVRVSGSGGTSPTTNPSLSGLAEKTTHSWRVRTTNNNSTFALTTRVTPNGSTTTVSVEYGNSNSYGSSAGSVNIGSGTTEVSSSWDFGSSSSATVYWRVTATYAGGATVQTTGTISRAVTIYDGTTTGAFTTYGTYSYNNDVLSMSVTKPSYGVNIEISGVGIIGGGGGGGNNDGANYGYGGGGGGQFILLGPLTSTGGIILQRGGGGAKGSAGGYSYFSYSGGTHIAYQGQPGSTTWPGGTSGNGFAGYAGSDFIGGGGGGTAGAATDINGGSGNTTYQVGPGGPGYNGYSGTWGVYIYGTATSAGAGGKGLGYSGADGSWSITYVGPARN